MDFTRCIEANTIETSAIVCTLFVSRSDSNENFSRSDFFNHQTIEK